MTLRVVLVLALVSASHCYAQTGRTLSNEERQKIVQQVTADANAGNADAQNWLGGHYELQKDYTQAAAWYRKSAEQGHPFAQYNLGALYNNGQGAPQDYAEAARWYRKAADQGNPDGQFSLGLMYRGGSGVQQNFAEAVKWLRKAGDQGHSSAQFWLGFIYDFGEGVQQDYAEAAGWFRKAAEQGDATAQRDLGFLYKDGHGVTQDYSEAARWFRKAAEQGDDTAQHYLGLAYEGGEGVPQDYVEAYMWLNLAAAGTLPPMVPFVQRDRDALLQKMSHEQIAQAQELTRNWKPKAGKDNPEAISLNSAAAAPQLASTGTGFFVSQQGYILTNYHVIGGCVALKTRINAAQPIIPVAQDEGNDLALLKAAQPVVGFATFSAGPVRVGQSVMVVGYPLRGLLSSGANVTTGNISAIAGPNDDTGLLQITAPVQPGNSGGPLLDQSGNVIGVVVAKLDAVKIARATGDIPQNVNFAIKGAVVRSFLEANGVEFPTAASNTKLDPAVIAERAAKLTVVVECWK